MHKNVCHFFALQFLSDRMRYIAYDCVNKVSCKYWSCYTESSPSNSCTTLSNITGVTVVDSKYLMLENFVVYFDAQ